MQTSLHRQCGVRRVQQSGFRHQSQHCRPAAAVHAVAAKIPATELLNAAVLAARKGAEVVMDATSKPKQISRKDGTPDNIVTETDKAAEVAVISSLQAAFPTHAILGEEGGVLGDVSSEYLWCIDPIDGTCNFSTGYMSFCVSVGVLRHALPVAGCVIEFVGGGPGGVGHWQTREFTAARNNGSFLDGKPLRVSRTKKLHDAVVATEACWDEERWPIFSKLYGDFTRQCRGVRMSGAAAANLCHLAMGVIDGYWQYDLKPWDVAAGALILEEAGGRLTTGDGIAWSVFDRSMVASNDYVHEQITAFTEPATLAMREGGADLRPWYAPKGYGVKGGAQLA